MHRLLFDCAAACWGAGRRRRRSGNRQRGHHVSMAGSEPQDRDRSLRRSQDRGVTCYVSRSRAGGIKGGLGLAEDTSDASIACRQVGRSPSGRSSRTARRCSPSAAPCYLKRCGWRVSSIGRATPGVSGLQRQADRRLAEELDHGGADHALGRRAAQDRAVTPDSDRSFIMSIVELLPLVESLPHADKLKLMQFLLTRFAREEGVVSLDLPEDHCQDPLWSIIGMRKERKTMWPSA